MAKHSQGFIEVVTRLYIPLGHDFKEFQEITLADFLKKSGDVKVHSPNKRKKGAQNGTKQG